ncbi:hypothetical protein DFH29DRAFT_881297 [Suillus ampliporus]|nr:hypothetical protein DFH29DRAFT_881297 [Suillus ampliporus]
MTSPCGCLTENILRFCQGCEGGRAHTSANEHTEEYLYAASVFIDDEDPKVREYFQAHSLAFVKSIQGRFTSLRKKYNEINLQLGQTGAGLSFEELNENEKTKTLLDHLLQMFLWWWRTNPAYNTSFSTVDPGQDSAAEAMDVFGKEKGKETALDDTDHEDSEGEDAGPLNEDLEPGKILDHEAYKDDDPPV